MDDSASDNGSASPCLAGRQAVGVYAPTDLVYVNPEARAVVSKVQWISDDRVKSLSREDSGGGGKSPSRRSVAAGPRPDGGRQSRRGRASTDASTEKKRRLYPFGTYRSMCNAFRLEGKKKEEERGMLEEVLPKVLEGLW